MLRKKHLKLSFLMDQKININVGSKQSITDGIKEISSIIINSLNSDNLPFFTALQDIESGEQQGDSESQVAAASQEDAAALRDSEEQRNAAALRDSEEQRNAAALRDSEEQRNAAALRDSEEQRNAAALREVVDTSQEDAAALRDSEEQRNVGALQEQAAALPAPKAPTPPSKEELSKKIPDNLTEENLAERLVDQFNQTDDNSINSLLSVICDKFSILDYAKFFPVPFKDQKDWDKLPDIEKRNLIIKQLQYLVPLCFHGPLRITVKVYKKDMINPLRNITIYLILQFRMT